MSAAFNLAESDTERPPWIQLFGIEIVGVTVTAQAWAENAVAMAAKNHLLIIFPSKYVPDHRAVSGAV